MTSMSVTTHQQSQQSVVQSGPLSGVLVVELATWVMVPSATAVLSDWGAQVIKIEHPDHADPIRGKVIGDLDGTPKVDISVLQELANRGKRSAGINIANPGGRRVLEQLIRRADVFVTNLLPEARKHLSIDVADIRSMNANIIYARASGQGSQGPDAGLPGFDHTSFWARSGLGHAASQVTGDFIQNPGPTLGDIVGGLSLAGGIASALYGRRMTGEPSVVDTSLLATAMWTFGPAIVASELYDTDTIPRRKHSELPNAFVAAYLTQDHRYIYVGGLHVSDLMWAALCRSANREDLLGDWRFETYDARQTNVSALIAVLDDMFAARTVAQWMPILADCGIPFAKVQTARELHSDPQVRANSYLREVKLPDGGMYTTVASPVQFDGLVPDLVPSPAHGEHTDEILTEYGFDPSDILEMKIEGTLW